MPPSKLVDPKEYKEMRGSAISDVPALTSPGNALPANEKEETNEEKDKKNMYRRNLYVSKPYEDINKDYKFKPPIRNAA